MDENTVLGEDALVNNTAGINNTAIGNNALSSNTTGKHNTATGFGALLNNTTGSDNTATGMNALSSKTTGDNNIAVGFQAGVNLFAGSNNIYIGNPGLISESWAIRIGTTGGHPKTFIAGISGVTVPGGGPSEANVAITRVCVRTVPNKVTHYRRGIG